MAATQRLAKLLSSNDGSRASTGSMRARIVLLPGDGIGPEVIREAKKVLIHLARVYDHDFAFSEELIGGCAIDACGEPLPERTVQACQDCDAVLLGAVGGPKWSDPKASVRPEQGLLGIRKALGLFANLRPVKVVPALISASPLRPERLANTDLLMVRELTGGAYFGQPRLRETTNQGARAVDTTVYYDFEVRRVAKLAFELGRQRRKKVTSIDKANVLETSRLWRETVDETAKDYPDVTLDHQLVDSAAMRLVTHPSSFDVIVTENLFGDILSDEAAVLTGSLGMLPSASLGEDTPGLFEPIHGSAPDIAGKSLANPLGTILSAAMLLRFSLKLETEAAAIEHAVSQVLSQGIRTADLLADNVTGLRQVSTQEMGDAVCTFM